MIVLIFGVLLLLHILAVIGLFVIKNISPYTILLQFVIYLLGGFAITAGYHRLWCHRSYKASPLLEWLFMIFGSSTGQGDAIAWSKTHRSHHRNEDTESDPYNIKKGFYFAHIKWTYHDHEDNVQQEIDSTDVSDLEAKEVLQFQQKYILLLWITTSFVLPLLLTQLWKESLTNAFFSSIIRQVLLMHCIFSVNSFAHMYGLKPYNSDIEPSENAFVSFIALGEGWHNFHHTYPKDYRTSDPSKYNPTTYFIDTMGKLGLVKNKQAVCEKTYNVRGKEKFNKDNYCIVSSP